jgi:predicted dehydrogenase
VDVVRDLMIHDIGVLQLLLGEEPEDVVAVGLRVASDWIDVASARLRFPSGCVAALTASRVSERPLRRMRVFERDGCLSVDFLAGPEDALLAQLQSFVAAVRCRERPGPAAAGALGALRTALRVVDAMRGPANLPRREPQRSVRRAECGPPQGTTAR